MLEFETCEYDYHVKNVGQDIGTLGLVNYIYKLAQTH